MQLISGNKTLEGSLKNRNPNLWNNWKLKINPKKKISIEIRNFNFQEKHKIYNYNFDKVVFINCQFIKTLCKNSTFQNSKFTENCRFEGRFDDEIKRIIDTKFYFCNFDNAVFEKSYFQNAILENCFFTDSTFLNTKFLETDFFGSNLIFTKFKKSSIIKCKVFGTNVWEIEVEDTVQEELIIENYRDNIRDTEEIKHLCVYDIEVAHLINLLTNNEKFTNVFNASKSTYVLILGRFENISRLNKIKNEILKTEDLSPILFDWKEKTPSLNLVETIVLLASLSKFIIVDLSNPKSAPAELQAILSNLMIPVIPLLQSNEDEPYALFSFTNNFSWVKEIIVYDKIEQVIDKFETAIIKPANKIAKEIERVKSFNPEKKHINDIS